MIQNILKVNKQKNLKRDVFFLPHQQQHSMCVHIENTTYSTQYVCMQYYPEIQFPVFKKQAKSKQIFTAELQHFFSRVQKQLLMFVLWFSKVDDEGQVHHFHFTLSFSILCSSSNDKICCCYSEFSVISSLTTVEPRGNNTKRLGRFQDSSSSNAFW